MRSRHITVYGCEENEADLFRTLSPKYGFELNLIREELSEENASLSDKSLYVSVGHKTEISRSLLKALKSSGVHYLCTRSIGLDHIDREAAREMGIIVGNVNYSPGSVADYTIMLMLMIIRRMNSILSDVAKKDFRLNTGRGKELSEMTVGVLGAGRIGRAVIERLEGFGCHILFYDHAIQKEKNPYGAELKNSYGAELKNSYGVEEKNSYGVELKNRENLSRANSFSELLKNSDILTIHIPLNDSTLHLIGREEIESMKPGAFLINTARGGIVDTKALIAALENGKLGGAALDVLEDEKGIFYLDHRGKKISHPYLSQLLNLKNVVITPHTAYYTERALRDIVEETLKNCLELKLQLLEKAI